jgi:hypothetical protein
MGKKKSFNLPRKNSAPKYFLKYIEQNNDNKNL